ncbi:MAG: response regulator [Kiritimatiellae bacterium]|nr:response regulator [Kiritimatiellia bacterium]MDW8458337.1 response regulator [Verrucomicrobiota bacterium]
MNSTILVIDDDELVRTGLAADLSREGFSVLVASGGQQALEMLRTRRADLVLCDLVLGDMDGIDVLRRIKSEWPETAVVMITGHASIRNVMDALRSGASDYIAKPADPDEVAHRLKTVLDAERLRRALAEERGRVEARRREMQDLLIRSERMASLATLAVGAAEELKKLLDPALEHLASIRHVLPAEHSVLEPLRTAVDQIERARAALADLEAIGRVTSYEKAAVSLNELIERCVRDAQNRGMFGYRTKALIELRLDPLLPAVYGSQKALEKCVFHLLALCADRVSRGGIVSVETAAEQLEHSIGRYGSGKPGEYVSIAFRDTGPEWENQDLDRLIEPFYLTRRGGWRFISGLSMALVHRIVSDHGGFLDARVNSEKGSLIAVYLPVESGAEILSLRPDYTGAERILVVDDNAEHRRGACEILSNLGYEVIGASSGREAVRLFESSIRDESQRIDLVVIDLVLGDEFDGVETFKKLIEIRPGQPAVLVSGFADLSRIVEARKLGIRQTIQKPYTTEALGAAVRAALDH